MEALSYDQPDYLIFDRPTGNGPPVNVVPSLKARPSVAEATYDESRLWLPGETPKSWRRRLTRSGLWTPGHKYFPDCQRETYAHYIQWAMWAGHPKPDVWFGTFTFKTFVTDTKSTKLLIAWVGRLKQAYDDKGSHRLRWICATEWQRRDVVHFHLLISGVGLSELSRKRWEVRWETGDRNAGFCRIYDADRKAAPYLAKYMNKGGAITAGGYWRGLKAPGSVSCCQPRPIVYHSVEPRWLS
jgi:hypothetical protein